MNFLQRTPFFRLLLALVSGIVLFQYIPISPNVLLLFLIVSLLVLFIPLIVRNSDFQFRFRYLSGVVAFIIFLIVGYGICFHFERKNHFTELNHRAIYEVELITAPVAKARSYSFRVELLQRYDSLEAAEVCGKAILYLQKDSVPHGLLLGDRIMIDAEFKVPDGVQNPSGFDYATYLKRQGVGATAYIASGKWKRAGRNPAFSVSRFANQCRNYLLEIYKRYGITDDEFAVLAALTLGYTDSLEPDIYKLYSHTGAVHILSVSGLHVGIVYIAIVFLLGFLKRTRKEIIAKALISILFIWAYAIITGLSPAVLRAAMMMSFVAFGTCLNRKSQIYNTVLASAFFLLIFNPNLLFNIGFQLSYSAVLSIVAFQKTISKWYTPKHKLVKWAWSLTAVSLAAQLGTAPISIYYFNQFPNYFLLTNYVAIPLSTWIIYSAILLFFVSFIPLIAGWVGFMLKWMIWLMNYLLGVIMELPGSISVISITDFQLLCIIIAFFLLTAFAFNKKFWSLSLGLGFILLFFVSFAVRQKTSLQSSKLVVFSDSRTPIINFIAGKNNFVYTNNQLQALNTAHAYWRTSMIYEPQFIEKNDWFDDGYTVFQGKRILILKDDLLKNKTTTKPLEVDYLILTNRMKPRMENILACVIPGLVIIDKSISPWYTNHVIEVCQTHGVNYYSVAESGAFVEEF